ncbi:unnamed protein product, partial [Lepidochelys olivacea]
WLTGLVLREPELRLVLSAYADDVLLGSQDDTSTFTFVQAHSSAIWPAPFSDHHLVTVKVSLRAERPGPAYWHFNNSLLEDESFVMSFREFWLAWREQWRAFPSVRRWWDLGKVRAKLFCHDYTRGTSRRRNAAIEQLEREVLEMERRLAADPKDPSLCGACREKREELRALEDHRARGAFVRSRICLLREMDRGSRFFYALEKTRGAKKHMSRMTGLVLREPELRLVLSAYADDVLLVVQDPGDLARVEACQAIYSAASSTRVNWVKSSGLAVGDWRSVAATVGADLLTEPLLHNPQLRVQVAESRSVRQRLVLAEVTRVGDLLDYDRRDWLDPLTLARRMGLSSLRTPRRVLQE